MNRHDIGHPNIWLPHHILPDLQIKHSFSECLGKSNERLPRSKTPPKYIPMNVVGMRHLHICPAQVRFLCPYLYFWVTMPLIASMFTVFWWTLIMRMNDLIIIICFGRQKHLVIKSFNLIIKVCWIIVEIDTVSQIKAKIN